VNASNAKARSNDAADPAEFVLTRVFDAPRERVWRAFTDVEQLKQWWGPSGFKPHAFTLDLRPGGVFHYGMTAPDGSLMWGKWIFREIVKPERLVILSSFSDKDGGVTRHPMAPDWPLQMLGTMTFAEQDGKTLLTSRTVAFEASEAERKTFAAGFDSMRQGFKGTWDQLDAHLAKA
jgi:uncharacterized protein YndB with AHSA1/START domain